MDRKLGWILILFLCCACGANLSETKPEMGANTETPQGNPSENPTTQATCSEPYADYRLTFISTWSATTHPYEFPSNAHFSRLIGGTHNLNARFWHEGDLASEGIENMAERGGTDTLASEIEDAIDLGHAFEVIRGDGLDDSPDSTSLTFRITAEFPLITMVSMVAPSPDWFVGVDSLALCENQEWLESKTVTLFNYDAGTDGGASYSSADIDLNPQQPIQILLDAHFSENGEAIPLGTFTFTRL